jgi:5-hydroxyisourate hydrolase
MDDAGPTISTHVLDAELGRPAADLPVRLSRMVADGALVQVGEARTDPDGRIHRLLRGPLTPGIFRITFELHEYRRAAFFREVTLEISVDDASRSYHVPLLVAGHAVTSYRGS